MALLLCASSASAGSAYGRRFKSRFGFAPPPTKRPPPRRVSPEYPEIPRLPQLPPPPPPRPPKRPATPSRPPARPPIAPAAPGRALETCETCFILDITGPDNTSSSATWNWLSYKSCAYEGWSANTADNMYATCCALAQDSLAASLTMPFDYDSPDRLFTANITLAGFDTVRCSRTTLRVCGNVTSDLLGADLWAAAQKSNRWLMDQVLTFHGLFGNTDDSCPMGMWNSTARLTTAMPNSDKPDTTCMPIDATLPLYCGLDKDWNLGNDIPDFPNSDCVEEMGATPFAVDPYMEVVKDVDLADGTKVSLDCIHINVTAPKDESSSCAAVSTLDKVSFWMWDDDANKMMFDRGVWLRIKNAAGEYELKPLTVTWGPTGDNAMFASGLGLSLDDVDTRAPMVCFARDPDAWGVWETQPVDGTGFIWTALYDASEKCCPTYYANRF
ncbi:hypothetical protein HYH03_014620 [Edaphochlamys debaryana]|uniref:Pherophorin domain-containing protein n=1 Tax=Edaphochlamys debaryana TaxID=47281 RepID=A0A835XMP0_9CHLO|nr:hypothetical protein HYH03_014620 [Edaphochlamys debaryana]|eukprot:KAG2486691.1 hypothetical protein HYH03_014620 [Edaphochlamys debaryana]